MVAKSASLRWVAQDPLRELNGILEVPAEA